MTLMDAPEHSFRPRLVLWPRGNFLFGSNLSGFRLHRSTDAVQLALRFLWHHFANRRSRLVPFDEWTRIAESKMGMRLEAAFAVFSAVQHLMAVHGEERVVNLQQPNLEAKADVLGLVLVLALSGCTEGESGRRDVVGFLKSRLDEVLTLLLLCHYHLANEHIQTPRFAALPPIERIPRAALMNLDPLLEGTIRVEKTMSTADVVPQPFSSLVGGLLRADQNDEFEYADVARAIRKSIQLDMFALDEMPKKKFNSNMNGTFDQTSRTVTSTQLAEHRKLTVRQWTHMEILTKSTYRGANLRVQQDSFMTGSFVFCLRALRTALVASSTDCGPVVLGPVSDVLVCRNLRNVTISAVCSRIQVENCQDVTLFVNTPTAPLVSGNCANIRFAPYNVYYDGLHYELKYAGMELLDQFENQWNRAVCVEAADGSGGQTASFHPLPVDQFFVQPTPFVQTLDSPFYELFCRTIPLEFASSFEKRRAMAAGWVERNPEHKLIGVSEQDVEYLQRRVEN